MRRLLLLLVLLKTYALCADSNFARPSSSRAINLARMAQKELAKNSPQGIFSAISILERLCQDQVFKRLQIDERYEIYKSLAIAYERNKAYDKQEKLLLQLLQTEAFTPYYIDIKAQLVNCHLLQNQFLTAADFIKQLNRIPERKISSYDRDTILCSNKHFQEQCKQKLVLAEQLYQMKQWQKAKEHYVDLFALSLTGHFPQTLSIQSQREHLDQIALRLAYCHYLQDDINGAHSIFTKYSPKLAEAYFLQGIIAKNQARFEEATGFFIQCKTEIKEALWEGAFCALKAADFVQTHQLLQELKLTGATSQARSLELLLALEEKNYSLAETLLESHDHEGLFSFLKGALFFHKNMPDFACIYLEQAIENTHLWQDEALFLLGTTYLQLSQNSYPEAEREVFFERAVRSFEELMHKSNYYREKSARSLAKCHFVKGNLQRLNQLAKDASLSPSTRYEIQLSIAEKTKQYSEVLSPIYKHEFLYPKALALASHFEAAYLAFLDSHEIERDFFLIREICIYAMRAGNFADVSKILKDLESKLFSLNSPLVEECLFLHLEALNQMPTNEAQANAEIALMLSDYFLTQYPQSQNKFEVLFLKGVLLWKCNRYKEALDYFEQAKSGTHHRDELLFFVATSKDCLRLDAKSTYLELYSTYPDSRFAHESYFRYFPESAYIRQEIQAIAHLQKMPQKMHSSLYGVLGNWYLGVSLLSQSPKKGMTDSQRRLLQEAVSHFDLAIDNGLALLPSLLPSIKASLSLRLLRAKFERAQALYILGHYAQVRHALDELKIELQNSASHPDLWQEASYLKSRVLLLEGQEALSREELAHLLDYSQMTGYEKGDVLIRALIETATLLSREENYLEAEKMLAKAQVVQSKGTSVELGLEVLIAKSQLHQKKGELDLAMMLLSSVINDESASSLRIQAMYLRAELYELKGRRDLAFRQLQAASKKGGEWGQRSRQKLEDKYGYE